MKHILLLLCIFITFKMTAQEKNINLNVDPRLESLVKASHTKPKETSTNKAKTARGFRVQIYNGNDRNKASELKMKFMKAQPGTRSYLVFANPQYRLKVGDFKTRADAEDFQNKINDLCTPCMVITETINLSSSK